MRIISGAFGGRKICAASDTGLRPAMARTRESLFSMLEARGMDWQGALVLDIFAGSGSLALECLSRGAESAVLVDSGRAACACAARNIASLGVQARAKVVEMDALRFLRSAPHAPFDLIFLDPPYRRNLANPAFKALASGPWLKTGAFLVSEIEKDAEIIVPDDFEPVAQRLFGQTNLCIWKNR